MRRRLPSHPDEAEAIAQEAFARAWASFARFSGDRAFWPWLSTIARRLSVDFLRECDRDRRIAGNVRAAHRCSAHAPEDGVILEEERRMALRALESLRPRERRLVELRHMHGWSYEEIANFEAVTVDAVRGTLKRARIALRRAYAALSDGTAVLVPLAATARRRRLWLTELVSRVTCRLPGASPVASLNEGTVAALVAVVIAVGLPYSPLPPKPAPTHGGPAASALASSGRHAIGRRVTSTGATVPIAAKGVAHDGAHMPIWGPGSPSGDAPPTRDAGPDYGTYEDVAAAPDGSVFASWSSQDQSCDQSQSCRLLYRSTDRGRTWTRLPARGFLGGELLFPPTFPADNRIFTTSRGLQVSRDGGLTFTSVAPLLGPGAVPPDFAQGRERVVVGTAPGWSYDDGTGLISPADLSPIAANPPSANVAFSPSYATDRTAFVGAYGSLTVHDELVDTYTTVHRCQADVCREVFRANDGTLQRPLQVATAPSYEESGIVWAWNTLQAWRSHDFGHTFTPVPLPTFAPIADLVLTETAAYLAIRPVDPSTPGLIRVAHGDDTWHALGAGTPLAHVGTAAVVALPDGHLVAAVGPRHDGRGELWWSDDDGATWYHPG